MTFKVSVHAFLSVPGHVAIALGSLSWFLSLPPPPRPSCCFQSLRCRPPPRFYLPVSPTSNTSAPPPLSPSPLAPRPTLPSSPKPLCFSQKESKSKYSYFLERPNCVVSFPPSPFSVDVVAAAAATTTSHISKRLKLVTNQVGSRPITPTK